MTKYVYFFGNGEAEGNAKMRDLLGGKGANLAEMTNLGIPVPPGFTISTEACREYSQVGGQWPTSLEGEVREHLARLEKTLGAQFGSSENPLLVSVRSGAAVSMPGMMDTVLNLGLTPDAVAGLAKRTDNPRFAWDSYRRFINMFGDVVSGVPHEEFERILHGLKTERGYKLDTELNVDDLQLLVEEYLSLYQEKTGEAFPTDPWQQLVQAINAVFGSWNNERAKKYRRLNDIRGLIGTAVNVQSMVYGNMGESSATGVAFTRDPATGANEFYGEYLINAQGEDVVAGTRTPEPIAKLGQVMKPLYDELVEVKNRLERHYRDVQDLEFTIQDGKLYLLQTRSGKRTSAAAVKIAVDMVKEGMIDQNTALQRINPGQIDQFLHPNFDPKAERKVIGKGLPASPGAATGKVYFTADDAEEAAHLGEAVILVRTETSPEDIGGMHAAKGILTARGGSTSHAAVVARGMGKCCVAGCDALSIDEKNRTAKLGGATINEGDAISLDGTSGEVMLGEVPTIEPELPDDLLTMLQWADQVRRLKVRTNADTPEDAARAREFGAEGIGLCRTEHMFFDEERIKAVREMILADDTPAREKALAKLLPEQRKDFVGIFQAMAGLPVTVRLLDPPLHEFLPFEERNQKDMAEVLGVDVEIVKEKVKLLHETNPMLGHRGCRLGVTYPEIYDMQVRAILEAAREVARSGQTVVPEIMIPLVGSVKELSFLRERAQKLVEEIDPGVPVLIGTMIEVPRAALTADKVAESADFFSFGTNDLTQMALGLSRDDTGFLLEHYVATDIYEKDPFVSIDVEGVGQLVRMACEKGRQTKPDIKLGICGEHGGDPASIHFCEEVGLDYVSCSPFRVPIARLAAAQAVLKKG